MNIVDLVKEQISGPMTGKLASMIGLDEDKTRSVMGAAVPSILSWFSSLASTTGGAQKLAGALERMDSRSPGSMAGILSEPAEVLAEKGSSMAESLIGGAGTTGIADSLAQSFGIESAAANKVLGFLTPTALSVLGRQFSSRGIDPESLSAYFTQQRSNISRALPASFDGPPSEAQPGMDRVKGAFASVRPSNTRWLVPTVVGLVGVAIVILLARSRIPTAERQGTTDMAVRMGDDLKESVNSLTGTLSGVKDAASADAALPKIEAAKGQLEEIRASASQLPQEGRAKFDQILSPCVDAIRKESDRIASVPGAEKIKPVLDDLVARLSTPIGSAPGEENPSAK